MYKVFVNDKPIFIGDAKKISTKLKCGEFRDTNILKSVISLFETNEPGLCLSSNNLANDWRVFKNLFREQIAAGGKVKNLKGEILFIYRNKKWDLPKGIIERGESIESCALREVAEECGVTGLTIEKELETTYHIFKNGADLILKITHWFQMTVQNSGSLRPQIEEGIEEVCFKDHNQQIEALKNTYENIKLLFHH